MPSLVPSLFPRPPPSFSSLVEQKKQEEPGHMSMMELTDGREVLHMVQQTTRSALGVYHSRPPLARWVTWLALQAPVHPCSFYHLVFLPTWLWSAWPSVQLAGKVRKSVRLWE